MNTIKNCQENVASLDKNLKELFLSWFYWVLLGFTGLYWVLLGFTGFYWVLLGFTVIY